MIRFLHSGDWQLGMTRSVLGDEAQARFAEARIAVVRRLGELARAERCGFVLVCGDVFESSQVGSSGKQAGFSERPRRSLMSSAPAPGGCRWTCSSPDGRSTKRPCCGAGYAYEQATEWHLRVPVL